MHLSHCLRHRLPGDNATAAAAAASDATAAAHVAVGASIVRQTARVNSVALRRPLCTTVKSTDHPTPLECSDRQTRTSCQFDRRDGNRERERGGGVGAAGQGSGPCLRGWARRNTCVTWLLFINGLRSISGLEMERLKSYFGRAHNRCTYPLYVNVMYNASAAERATR